MTIPGIDDAFDAADAILWPEGRNAASDGPGSKLISDALVAACKVVAAATREAVAQEIGTAIPASARYMPRKMWVGMCDAYRHAAEIARGPRRVPVDGKEQQQ